MNSNEWALYDGIRKEAVSKLSKLDEQNEKAEEAGEKKDNVSFPSAVDATEAQASKLSSNAFKEDWKHGSSKMEKFLDELDQVLSRGVGCLYFLNSPLFSQSFNRSYEQDQLKTFISTVKHQECKEPS